MAAKAAAVLLMVAALVLLQMNASEAQKPMLISSNTNKAGGPAMQPVAGGETGGPTDLERQPVAGGGTRNPQDPAIQPVAGGSIGDPTDPARQPVAGGGTGDPTGPATDQPVPEGAVSAADPGTGQPEGNPEGKAVAAEPEAEPVAEPGRQPTPIPLSQPDPGTGQPAAEEGNPRPMAIAAGPEAEAVAEPGRPMTPIPLTQPENKTSTATYWVTFSTSARPGMTLPVSLHFAKADAKADVYISIRNGSNHSIVFAEADPLSVNGGGSYRTELKVPRTLERPGQSRRWFQYVLRVMATGSVFINETHELNFNQKAFSVFVQTDKAIYKPGQTVKFRALAMTPDLRVLNESMDIFVRDPLGNGIKHWRHVHNKTGVVEKKFPTSSDPPLGNWKVEVTVLGHTESKVFTIDTYVLPKFEAKAEVPSVVLTSAPALTGKAIAKYTFGKPLTNAEATVTVKHTSFYSRRKGQTQPKLTQSGMLNKDGEFPFVFSKQELIELTRQNSYYNRKTSTVNMNNRRLSVTVNVTNLMTSNKMGAVSTVKFVQNAAKIRFLTITPKTYKPGLKYRAHVSVVQPDGSLFQNYKSINVTFQVNITVPLKNTTTTTSTTTTATTTKPKTEKEKKMLADIDLMPTERPHWRRVRDPTKDMTLTTVTKTLTANGLLDVEMDVPSHARKLIIEATAMGVSRRQVANRAASGSDNFVQIQALTVNAKAGHMATMCVRATEHVSTLYYQLYSKGILLNQSHAIVAESTHRKFNVTFRVMENMAPNCRLLVFYFRNDGEVVADSLSFKVDADFKNSINVTYNTDKVKPGEQVNLTVAARPDTTVFLLGVDKSVNLLKDGNDITKEMVDRELLHYDFSSGSFFGYWRIAAICGWPWSSDGVDAYSIFQGANVAMITDGNVFQKDPELYSRRRHGDKTLMAMRASAEGDYAVVTSLRPGSVRRLRLRKRRPAGPASERVRTVFPESWLWDSVVLGYWSRLAEVVIQRWWCWWWRQRFLYMLLASESDSGVTVRQGIPAVLCSAECVAAIL